MIDSAPEASVQAWLESYIRTHAGVAGTVHRRSGEDLLLVAAMNIPPKVQDIVRVVPKGKGMAGLAFLQDTAIATCNIRDDNTGRVKPGAKAIDARAGVALPVHDGAGAVRAVVGIAFMEEKELTESELAALGTAAATLPPLG